MKEKTLLALLTFITLLTAAPGQSQSPAPPAPSVIPPPAPLPISSPETTPATPTPKLTPPPLKPPAKSSTREIVVAWEASLMYLFENGRLIREPIIINVGRHDMFNPVIIGDHVITEKLKLKRSNLYDVHGNPLRDRSVAEEQGAVMRYWMRIGKTAIGFHFSPAFRFYAEPSKRHRSHGCFRLRKDTAVWLFNWVSEGTPVHVVKALEGTQWAFLREKTPAELIIERKTTLLRN